MVIPNLYSPLKDLFLYLKNRNKVTEGQPIVWSGIDIKQLIDDGRLDGKVEDYSFSRPDRVYQRTEGSNPTHEIAWVVNGNEKQKVICLRYDGQIDLILLKRKPTD